MAEKKTTKKENSEVDLDEILGNIKTVVSEEKEALFKVSNYKTIKLKKENLINSGKKNHSSALTNLNNKELEELVKKIVRSELKNLQFNKPWWLAGGVSIEWIDEILTDFKPDGLDISSSIETSPGLKDIKKTEELFKLLKRI